MLLNSSASAEEQRHDILRRIRIQRGGGFIRDHDRRAVRQGAPDGHPLALARGQGIRPLLQLVVDTERLGEMVDRSITLQAEHAAGEVDIVAHRQVGQQAAGLHHVADMPLAHVAEPVEIAGIPAGIHVDGLLRRHRVESGSCRQRKAAG